MSDRFIYSSGLVYLGIIKTNTITLVRFCQLFVSENVALYSSEQKVKFKCLEHSIELSCKLQAKHFCYVLKKAESRAKIWPGKYKAIIKLLTHFCLNSA